MWTGAFIYKSYFVPRFLGLSVRHPGFGQANPTEHALDRALGEVAHGDARGQTIAVLLGGWNGHVFHYYAHVHGTHYTSRKPGPVFATETWMTLGGARLMSIRREGPEYRAMQRLPVGAGDQVWILAHDAASDAQVRSLLPLDLALAATGDTSGPVRLFRVERSRP
jgi:hypothetical protein